MTSNMDISVQIDICIREFQAKDSDPDDVYEGLRMWIDEFVIEPLQRLVCKEVLALAYDYSETQIPGFLDEMASWSESLAYKETYVPTPPPAPPRRGGRGKIPTI